MKTANKNLTTLEEFKEKITVNLERKNVTNLKTVTKILKYFKDGKVL